VTKHNNKNKMTKSRQKFHRVLCTLKEKGDDDEEDDDEAVTRLLTAAHARRTIKNEFHSARVATKSPQRRVRVKRFIRNRTIDIRSHG